MTTTPTPSISVYPLAGTTTGPFATGWTYAETDDVWVYVTENDVQGGDLVDGVDYDLTSTDPQSDGGQVMLAGDLVPVGGWTAAHQLIVRRWTARRQGIALPDTEGHKPRATERGLDRAMRIAEELSDDLDLAVKVAPGETPPTAADIRALAGGIDGILDQATAIATEAGETAGQAAAGPVAAGLIRERMTSTEANVQDMDDWDATGAHDNAPSFQTLIDEAARGGVAVVTQGGRPALGSTIQWRSGSVFRGVKATGSGYGVGTDAYTNSTFLIAHEGLGFEINTGRSDDGILIEKIQTLRNQPPIPASGPWTPNEAQDYTWKIHREADVQLRDVLMPNATRGILAEGERLDFTNIKQACYINALTLDHSYDVNILENWRVWPLLSQHEKIQAYTRANLDTIRVGRCDHLNMKTVFSISHRRFLSFYQSADKTVPGASFSAAIAGQTLTVTAMVGAGRIAVGQVVSGTGVTAGTVVLLMLTGVGGVGTYLVSKTQNLTLRAMTTPSELFDGGVAARVVGHGLDGDVGRTSLFVDESVTMGMSMQISAFVAQGSQPVSNDPQIDVRGNQCEIDIWGFNCFENGGAFIEAPGVNNRIRIKYDIDYNRNNIGAAAIRNLGPGTRVDRMAGSIARDTGGFGTGEWDGSGTITGLHKGTPHQMAVSAQDGRPITYTSEALEWMDVDGWATLWFKITVTDDGSGSPTGGLLTNVRTAPEKDLMQGVGSIGGTGYALTARIPAGSLGLAIQDYMNAWPAPAVPGTPSVITGQLRYKTALAQ